MLKFIAIPAQSLLISSWSTMCLTDASIRCVSGAGQTPKISDADGERAEHQRFARVDVLQMRDVVVGHLAEDHALDQPQRVRRADDQRERRAGGDPRIRSGSSPGSP